MEIKAVVFDIGNVLLEWHPERMFDAEIGEDRRKALFAEVDLAEMNDRVDLGAPFRDTIYAKADAHPEWRDEILLWHDRWIEMASPEIKHSSRLMRALQAKGVTVISLTNFGIDSYTLAAQHYDIMAQFDHDFISGHMGVMKPDPAIYAQLEDKMGLSGGSLIFTDDRADNIAQADARGWKTHLFEHPQGWADRLVSEGLLTEKEAL
ncbi:MAG: HAD-IA family hydrolase [Aliishimia sp.]